MSSKPLRMFCKDLWLLSFNQEPTLWPNSLNISPNPPRKSNSTNKKAGIKFSEFWPKSPALPPSKLTKDKWLKSSNSVTTCWKKSTNLWIWKEDNTKTGSVNTIWPLKDWPTNLTKLMLKSLDWPTNWTCWTKESTWSSSNKENKDKDPNPRTPKKKTRNRLVMMLDKNTVKEEKKETTKDLPSLRLLVLLIKNWES